MELIYLYIEKFDDYIYQQGIQLSRNFEVMLQNKKLSIRKTQDHLENFYGPKIKNVSVLVGKNGSGKTTILDVLGMSRQDRLNTSIHKQHVEDEYFLLYYLGNDGDHDLFGIEVMGENVLHNMITDYDNTMDDERYDKSKSSIGKIYKYENDKLISVGKHFFDYTIEDYKLSELIRYMHIGEEYRYSPRNQRYGKYDAWGGGYIAERNMRTVPSIYEKYVTLVQCINNEIDGFDCDKAKIKFWDEIDYLHIANDETFKRYQTAINNIESELFIQAGLHILQRTSPIESPHEVKQNFIYDLYSRYIMDLIINGLYPLCDENISIQDFSEEHDFSYLIDDIKSFGSHTSSEEILGKPTNFELEVKRIQRLISSIKSQCKGNNEQLLKILARYIGSRIHENIENREFCYIEALEELIDGLFEIPDVYFHKNGIDIKIDERIPQIEKLLKIYSRFYTENYNNIHSDIGIKFKITFELLSEGEERFIDIITKIKDCITQNNDAKLLVLLLDEPDQSLHPEWSRRFIDIITRAINSIEFDGNIQLVLSTHSPYLLSDILPENVFLLERDTEKRFLHIQNASKKNNGSCFGANIYDLMQNDFFMNNTVGQFATRKINFYLKKIHAINLSTANIEEIEYFIDQIGEPLIQKAMKRQLEDKMFKLNIQKNKVKILDLITNQADREKVKQYLQMIED